MTTTRRTTLVLAACALGLTAAACGGPAGAIPGAASHVAEKATRSGTHACAMVTKEEMEAIVGAKFSGIEDNTEAGQSSTECNYNPPDGAMAPRVSLSIERGESIADAKAGFAGASAGGALGVQVAGPGAAALPGMRSGPIEGVGDEAQIGLNLLTVRQGTTLILIQASLINDPYKAVTDTAALASQLEKAKQIARAVIAKL